MARIIKLILFIYIGPYIGLSESFGMDPKTRGIQPFKLDVNNHMNPKENMVDEENSCLCLEDSCGKNLQV